MNIVFMGTPDFALPLLDALAGRHSVPLVFTRPDAASRRGMALLPSPVKARATERGIPVLAPRSFYAFDEGGAPVLNTQGGRVPDAALLARIAAAQPDFIVVAAYGMILPPAVLTAARYGCINAHASLLPRWRGAAPIQRAILAGDAWTGVSVMRMEAGLDTGAFCAQVKTRVGTRDATALTAELATLAATLVVDALPRIARGLASWTEQDESQVTYAEKIGKDELALDPACAARDNVRRVRASSAQAPARCVICGKPVTVTAAAVLEEQGAPHSIAAASDSAVLGEFWAPESNGVLREAPVFLRDKRLYLGTVTGDFEVCELKPDGKNIMTGTAFAAGVKALHAVRSPEATWSRR